MKNTNLILSILATVYTTQLSAQPGALDPTFSADGKLTTAFGTKNDAAKSVAIQADGKIVVAGFTVENTKLNFALARYNADGSLDSSFDADGKVSTAFGPGNDAATAVVIQPDGKIIAVGNAGLANLSGSTLALARYNPNGSLDNTFSGDGKLTTAYGSGFESAEAVVLQPDGKIVVAGSLYNGFNTDFGILRYLPDGTLDSTFSADGIQITPFGSSYDDAYAVGLQPDGKIVAAGRAFISPKLNFAVARYNPDGSLDTTFGTAGKLTTNVDTSGGIARALAIQPDGKIVVVGYVENGGDHDFALARYNPDGFLDGDFGGDGAFVTYLSSSYDEAYGVVLQPDGKIIVAGNTFTGPQGTNSDFALIRYNGNGTFDQTFGTNGLVTTSFSPIEDIAYAVALQPDGKIVAAGYSDNGQNGDFALARYLSGLSMGILDFSISPNAVLIYPNPVGQNATLKFTLKKEETLSVRLLDMQGKTVQSFQETEPLSAGDHALDLAFPAGLPAGAYVLVLSTAAGRVSVKIVR